MQCEGDHHFESLLAGLSVVSELDEQTADEDACPQLEQARSYLAQAGRNVGKSGFACSFRKAMGVASSVVVTHGYDELAEDALEIGGGQV